MLVDKLAVDFATIAMIKATDNPLYKKKSELNVSHAGEQIKT